MTAKEVCPAFVAGKGRTPSTDSVSPYLARGKHRAADQASERELQHGSTWNTDSRTRQRKSENQRPGTDSAPAEASAANERISESPAGAAAPSLRNER